MAEVGRFGVRVRRRDGQVVEAARPPATGADAPTDVIDLLAARLAAHPDHVAFLRRHDHSWVEVTTAEFAADVAVAAAALRDDGVGAGDRVLVAAVTSYPWAVADFAIWLVGAVTVPVYPTASEVQIREIVEDCSPRIGLADEPTRFAGLLDARPIDSLVRSTRRRGHPLDDPPELPMSRPRTALASIVHTSGSTGNPRGVEITHANLVSQARAVAADYPEIFTEDARTVIFLPLAHILARGLQVAAVASGMTVAHVDDPTEAVASLREVRPTFLVVVPRMLEKILERVRTTAAARHLGRIFAVAESVAVASGRSAETGVRVRRRDRLVHAAFDRLFYARIREVLGGELRWLLSGSAPLDAETSWFFGGAGVPVIEGYGLTETTAPATGNPATAIRSGSVGVPISGTTVRIDAPNSDGVGEVLVRGPGVSPGYWGQANDAPTTDGFLRTGDLGRLDADGYLTLTGRLRDLIVTAGGKNVAPGPWERAVEHSPLVEHALLVGDRRPYPAAVLFVGGRQGPDWTPLTDTDLNARLRLVVDAANASVSQPERVKRWVAVPATLSEERGLLTPTGKLRRGPVTAAASALIDQLYRTV